MNKCAASTDCSCGQGCSLRDNICAIKCQTGAECQIGTQCINGLCTPSCKTDLDCSLGETCHLGQCKNSCSLVDCGSNASCEVSLHKAVCLCRRGFQRSDKAGCRRAECATDIECNKDKNCFNGNCVNPCAVGQNPCGRNSECRVQNHKALCVCPPGFHGNPKISCHVERNWCLSSPCLNHPGTQCVNQPNSFSCECLPGCTEYNGVCKCPEPDDACSLKKCGKNARCRLAYDGSAICYCPSDYRQGDPNVECSIEGKLLHRFF